MRILPGTLEQNIERGLVRLIDLSAVGAMFSRRQTYIRHNGELMAVQRVWPTKTKGRFKVKICRAKKAIYVNDQRQFFDPVMVD